MKKFIQIVGILTFIVFSFFYTDKVLEVMREEDSIMIVLNQVKDDLRVNPINAVINGNTIVPGVIGKEVDINKSYKNMKNIGYFDKNKIVYSYIEPDISMKKNYDKYLVLGNTHEKNVSIIFILNQDKYLDRINDIATYKDVVINYFVDYEFLISNTIQIKNIKNNEFYSYGDKGKYTPDSLLFSSNLISRISNNNANLCLSRDIKHQDILDICSKNNFYTIVPNIIGGYDSIKNHLTNGSIILLNNHQDTVYELSVIIDYIKSKGFNIVGLSKIITEDLL